MVSIQPLYASASVYVLKIPNWEPYHSNLNHREGVVWFVCLYNSFTQRYLVCVFTGPLHRRVWFVFPQVLYTEVSGLCFHRPFTQRCLVCVFTGPVYRGV